MEKLKRLDFFPISAALATLAREAIGKIFGGGKKCANKRPHRPLRNVNVVSKQHRIQVKKWQEETK